jgi:methylmalonyl-CoA/ethylmalonyl-CoA epimerase
VTLRVTGLEHVGIAVADIDAALRAFGRLGFRRISVEDLAEEGIRSHVVEAAGVQLELLEVVEPDSKLAHFLAERGPGLHHLCLRVSSVDEAVRFLDAQALERATEPSLDRRGRRVFVHPRSVVGVLVGLVEPLDI